MSARDPRSAIAAVLVAAGYSHEAAEERVQKALDAHAHELAEKQRAAISDDSPAWVKVIPDLIDPEVGHH